MSTILTHELSNLVYTVEHYNLSLVTEKNILNSKPESFGRHEFVNFNPALAIPCLVVLGIASIVGTAGNVLILLVMTYYKSIRNTESIFIINLACSDLYVTLIADPMSIVAKLEGEEFFDSIPYLCQIIASICTISCVGSLMSISAMSVNRYFYICRQDTYMKVFTKRNNVFICCGVYSVGLFLVLMNLTGIGDHQFDRKSLECIWDRMATYPYTIVFSFALVWLPLIITGVCYLRVYLYVSNRRKRIEMQKSTLNQTAMHCINSHTQTKRRVSHQLHLAKALFIIYAVFMVCWIPYALLIVLDSRDTFPHEIHVYITVFAHLHPSLNWLIYCLTNRKFATAFRSILSCGRCQNLDFSSSTAAMNGNSKIYNGFRLRMLSENIQTHTNGSLASGFDHELKTVP